MSKLNDAIAFRKGVAGLSLLGFSIAGLASTLIGPATDSSDTSTKLYSEVAGHEGALLVSGILFMASSILLVPAAIGLVHLLRDRGVVLGHIGGAFALLGAAGHMALGTYYVMLARVPHAGDRTTLLAYLDRTNLLLNLLLPLLVAVAVGLLLLVCGLVRAGFAPRWVAGLVAAAIAVDFTPLANSYIGPAIVWTLTVVVFGYLGIRVLQLSRAQWAEPQTA